VSNTDRVGDMKRQTIGAIAAISVFVVIGVVTFAAPRTEKVVRIAGIVLVCGGLAAAALMSIARARHKE
jgi:hypothetical protein